MASVRLVFDRRKTASKSKKGTVELEVVQDRKTRKYMSTGIRVYAHQWYDRKGVYITGTNDATALNQKLRKKLSEVEDIISRMGDDFTLECLEKKAVKDSFIDYMLEKIDERNDIVERSKQQARHMVDVVKEHGVIIKFADVTERNVRIFDNWLRAKKYQQVTIWGYHKRLRSYVRMAVRDGYVDKYPYQFFKVSKGQQKLRNYLTDDELNRVRTCEIKNERVEKIRDLFVFQCYTGLAYVDLAKFNYQTDVENRKGKLYIIDARQKSGEHYYIQLLKPTLDILKKYDYSLPIVSNAKYNLFLKDVADYAGIDKNLTTHMARHTFAVWALKNGTKMEVLAKMLGHSDIKTTQIYAEIVQQSVDDAFDKLGSML